VTVKSHLTYMNLTCAQSKTPTPRARPQIAVAASSEQVPLWIWFHDPFGRTH